MIHLWVISDAFNNSCKSISNVSMNSPTFTAVHCRGKFLFLNRSTGNFFVSEDRSVAACVSYTTIIRHYVLALIIGNQIIAVTEGNLWVKLWKYAIYINCKKARFCFHTLIIIVDSHQSKLCSLCWGKALPDS